MFSPSRFLVLMVAAGPFACSSAGSPSSSALRAPDSLAQALVARPRPEVPRVPVPSLRTDTRPLPHDIAGLRWPMAVRMSPDGARVAYVVREPTYDPGAEPADDADRGGGWTVRQQLYVVNRQGGEPVQLTNSEAAVSSPAWSPDGREIAFLRRQGGKQALNVMPLAGGEPRVVDLGALEPFSFEWSPDGAAFAFTAELPPTPQEKAARFRDGGARVYEGEWRQTHLFVVSRDGGEPRHVNQGDESVVDFAWSPDGARFAVVVAPTSDPYQTMLFDEVRVISAETGAVLADLEREPVSVRALSWSPDGRYVAYQRPRSGLLLMNELRVHDLAGEDSWNAASGLDPTLMGFAWSGDSRSIVALVYERTSSKLYRLAPNGSSVRDLGIEERMVAGGMDTDDSGRYLATLSSTSDEPADPTVVDLSEGRAHVVARVNPQVAEWTLGRTEVVRWRNAEGDEIEGVLVETPHARQGEPPPLLVLPHGGPDWVSTASFSSWAHYFAARGYSVLQPNYRGGLAYGFEFYAANRGRLGEIEQADIESGVDHLVARGRADPDRLFFGGWSWGGYLTAWTITRTRRYRAAMVGAGVVDVVVQYATSDINHEVVADWEYQGRPWGQRDHFDRSNPARSLADVQTPTLIIHGEADPRVGFVNAQILYRALVDVGCETRFLAYPGEPHGFRQPAHVAHMLTEWAAWYDAHLAGPAE